MATISDSTLRKIALDFKVIFYDDFQNECEPNEASSIHVAFAIIKDDYEYIGRTIKLPKKIEVTYDWLLSKVNKQNAFVNFCDKFNSFLRTKNLRGYATSYGIGIESLFVNSKNLEENKSTIESELDRFGIKYTTEYSDAYWVFRYRISQSKDNIDRLNKATELI